MGDRAVAALLNQVDFSKVAIHGGSCQIVGLGSLVAQSDGTTERACYGAWSSVAATDAVFSQVGAEEEAVARGLGSRG